MLYIILRIRALPFQILPSIDALSLEGSTGTGDG
jgi:hypothetical protein